MYFIGGEKKERGKTITKLSNVFQWKAGQTVMLMH